MNEAKETTNEKALDLVTLTLLPQQRVVMVETLENAVIANKETLQGLIPCSDAFLRAERDGEVMHADLDRASARVLLRTMPDLMRSITLSRGRVLLLIESQLSKALEEKQ